MCIRDSPPAVDLPAEQRLAALVAAAAGDGVLTGAHDLSDGGLAQALVEACLAAGHGARVTLPADVSAFVGLFAESAARMLVTTGPQDADALLLRCAEAGVPAERLGETGGDVLAVDGVGELGLDELRTTWEATLPALFG